MPTHGARATRVFDQIVKEQAGKRLPNATAQGSASLFCFFVAPGSGVSVASDCSAWLCGYFPAFQGASQREAPEVMEVGGNSRRRSRDSPVLATVAVPWRTRQKLQVLYRCSVKLLVNHD